MKGAQEVQYVRVDPVRKREVEIIRDIPFVKFLIMKTRGNCEVANSCRK